MFDQIIVLIYLAITLFIGFLIGHKSKSFKEYAVGSRNFSALVLVATVFASVIDASGTVGLSESTFRHGPLFALAYLGIIFSHLTLALFIAPRLEPFLGLLSSGDIMGKLYGPKAKMVMGCSTLIESTLMTGAQILAMTQIAEFFFHWPPFLTAGLISLLIIVYCYRGGITSVAYTDLLQFAFLILAIVLTFFWALKRIDQPKVFAQHLMLHNQHSASLNLIDYLQYVAIFLSFSLPCLYPMCLQRMLMSKSTAQIKKVFLINGLFSLPFYLLIGILGSLAFMLAPELNPAHALPWLIQEIMPMGLKGLVIAGLLSVFMSTIDSNLNLASIAIAHDIFGSKLSPKQSLKWAKLTSVGVITIATAFALYANDVFSIMFLVMVLGNAVFFPGLLLGILGLRPHPKAFFFGVSAGLSSVIICLGYFKLFELYTMLISISANCAFTCATSWFVSNKKMAFKNQYQQSGQAQ